MLRTLIPTRLGLPLCWILCWPISEVMAGPIITAASGSPGQGSGDSPGDTRVGLTARLLSAVDLEMRDGSLPVREWPSGVGGVFPRGLSDLTSGTGTVGAAARSGAWVSGRGAPMAATVNSSSTAPSPMVAPASSPDRFPGSPTASGDPVTPAVSNPSIPAPIGRGTGSASTDPVSAQGSSASTTALRVPGTTVPANPGQAMASPSVGGASTPNSGSSSSGSTTFSASSNASIPQSSAAATATPNLSATAPAAPQTATATTSLSSQGAAAPGTGSSSLPSTGSINPASAPSSTSPGVSPAQAPIIAAPMTGSGTSVPPAATASTTLTGPGTANPMAAVPAVPVAGPSGQGSALPATGPVNLASSAVINTGGPSPAGSTNPSNTTTGTVTLIPAPGSPDGSSTPIAQVGQSNGTSLVTLIANPQSTLVGTSVTGLLGSTSSQLSAAVGGAGSLSTNTAATVALLVPTPLSASSALPPVQVTPSVLLAGTPDAIGGNPDSIVLPQNTPEPGVLALFAMVSAVAVIKSTASRLRSRS
jgi:hypothetical protein